MSRKGFKNLIKKCPRCSNYGINIEKKQQKDQFIAIVNCGHCELTKELDSNRLEEDVDVYGNFIDWFNQFNKITSKQQRLKDLDLGFLELP